MGDLAQQLTDLDAGPLFPDEQSMTKQHQFDLALHDPWVGKAGKPSTPEPASPKASL
jgi:hypothetical protein